MTAWKVCRNTYCSSSFIVIYLWFLQSHVGNTIGNNMQCTDSPSRNKVEKRRFDAAFCEVYSVFQASQKMPWAYS